MQTSPLRSSSPYPAADTLQFLEGNTASGALGNGNYFFGNLVIDVGGKPALFDPALAQEPFGALGAFGLQITAQPAVTRSGAVKLPACVALAVAGLSDSNHADINADKIRDLENFRGWLLYGSEQEPFAIAVHEVRFAALKFEKRSVAIAADERNLLATAQSPNVYALCVPRQDAQIISNRAVSAEHTLHLSVKLVSVGNLRNESYDNLRRKRKFVAHPGVTKTVNGELTKLFRIPRQLADAIGRSISRLKRRKQDLGLFGRGQQLHLRGQFHGIRKYDKPNKNLNTKNGIPLAPKGDSLLPKNL